MRRRLYAAAGRVGARVERPASAQNSRMPSRASMSSCWAPASSASRRRSLCRRAGARSTLVDRPARRRARRASATPASSRARRSSPILFPRAPGRDRQRRAQPRSARPYPLRRAAVDRAMRCGAISALLRPPREGETARRWRRFVGAAAPSTARLAEAAGAGGLLRRRGWIKVWRTARGEDAARRDVEELKPYGVRRRNARPRRR